MLLDISTGILISFFVTKGFGVDLTPTVLTVGIIASLFPDIDILIYLFQTKILRQAPRNHRTWTHYPSLYILPTVVIWFMLEHVYGTVIMLGLLFHFIHDTLWLGWGVKWFWPYSSRSYKMFPDRNGSITSIPLITWLPEEEKLLFQKYHNPNWIHDFYFRPTIVSITEYSVFIATLILLYFTYH